MLLNRRSFITTLLFSPLLYKAKILPTYQPFPRQLEFYGGAAGGGKSFAMMHLYGIPYHQSTGPINEWLGISREEK